MSAIIHFMCGMRCMFILFLCSKNVAGHVLHIMGLDQGQVSHWLPAVQFPVEACCWLDTGSGSIGMPFLMILLSV